MSGRSASSRALGSPRSGHDRRRGARVRRAPAHRASRPRRARPRPGSRHTARRNPPPPSVNPLKHAHDAAELVGSDPRRVPVSGRLPVGPQQLPRLVAEDGLRPPLVLERDSTASEPIARDFDERRPEAVVEVERGLHAQLHLARELVPLRDPDRRAVRREKCVVELRALARHPAPTSQRDEPDDGDAAQHEHVDVEDELPTLGSGDEGDGGEDGCQQSKAEDREELAAHATVRARSWSRTRWRSSSVSSSIRSSSFRACSSGIDRPFGRTSTAATIAKPTSAATKTRPTTSQSIEAGSMVGTRPFASGLVGVGPVCASAPLLLPLPGSSFRATASTAMITVRKITPANTLPCHRRGFGSPPVSVRPVISGEATRSAATQTPPSTKSSVASGSARSRPAPPVAGPPAEAASATTASKASTARTAPPARTGSNPESLRGAATVLIRRSVLLQVRLPSFWIASTKPERTLRRGKAGQPW